MSALLPFAAPARGIFIASALIAAVGTLLSLAPFWVIYQTVGQVMAGTATQDSLWWLVGIALAATVVRFVCMGIATYVSHVGAFNILYGIRITMAEHLAKVPLGFITRQRSGQIKKVMADDVEKLELFLAHAIPDAVSALLTLLFVSVWMFYVDWRVAIAALIFIVPAFAAVAFALSRSGDLIREIQASSAEMNAAIVELVRGMPVVKLFNRASDEVRGAESVIRHHVACVRRQSLAFLPFGTAFYVLLSANALGIVPVAGWLWYSGSLTTTELLFFLIVGLGALSPLLALLHLFANLAHISSGGKLVREILQHATLEEHATPAEPTDTSVEFNQVSFAYEADTPVLSEVSFRCEPGTLNALVGPSGGGKSTIAALIARFWDVDAGAIQLGGVDIRQLSNETLHRHVSVVLQDTFLFDDSVAGNLRIGKPDATQVELETSAREAQAHEFICALPDGYDTLLGEYGARLSGGERQRLAIARALLANAKVVLLDEATAFADTENETAIQAAIGRLVAGRTVIMIAHRLSTIVGCDQIIVVNEGRIVESGCHDELVEADQLYAELWRDFNAAQTVSIGAAQ
ncbi:MAG: ABC transporter ATP-binding protein [Pseudomonadota bacterium]